VKEKDLNILIGKNIRTARLLKGYSQDHVAKYLGVTFQQVQKYENGSNAVLPIKLIKLSQLFGCKIEVLLNDTTYNIGTHPYMLTRSSLKMIKNFEKIPSSKIQKSILALIACLH